MHVRWSPWANRIGSSSQPREEEVPAAIGSLGLQGLCGTLEAITGNVHVVICVDTADMRSESDKCKIESFMIAMRKHVLSKGRIYLTGGATAVLHGWRSMTINIDIKPDPEPAGLFEAIALLKEELGVNVELASPDQFIPALSGWRERSLFIAIHGLIEFFHYDPYGHALAKLQLGHERDLHDIHSFLQDGLIHKDRLRELFSMIEPQLIRHPAIDPAAFRAAVTQFHNESR